MKLKARYFAGVLVVLVIAVLTVRAEDFWIKKPWNQWSKDECNKILTDSPWSRKWSKASVTVSAALPGSSGQSSEGAGGEKSPEVFYYVQLRSSLPVREAVVRQQQIQGYAKLNDAQKKEFDAKAESLFNNSYDDVILVHVDYGSNVQTFEREMAVYWKNIREDSIPVDFYLINERGDRLTPARFVSPKNGTYAFDLVFPRLKNNEPVVRQGDKQLEIQFINPAVGTQSQATSGAGGSATALDPSIGVFGRERVLIQFKLDKMMVNGKLSF
jgi:hypothetical protein